MDCNCNGEHNHKEHEECGCNNRTKDIMYITLDDGSKLKCEVLGILDVEEKEYIALLPEGKEEVYIYRYKETEEGPKLSMIEGNDEFNKVEEVYDKLMS